MLQYTCIQCLNLVNGLFKSNEVAFFVPLVCSNLVLFYQIFKTKYMCNYIVTYR